MKEYLLMVRLQVILILYNLIFSNDLEFFSTLGSSTKNFTYCNKTVHKEQLFKLALT